MTQQLEHLNEEQLVQRIAQRRKKAIRELWWSRRTAAWLLLFLTLGGVGTFLLFLDPKVDNVFVAWPLAASVVVIMNAFFFWLNLSSYSSKPVDSVFCSELSSWMKADDNVAKYINAVNSVRTVTRYDYAVCSEWMDYAQERKVEAQQKEACKHVHGLSM